MSLAERSARTKNNEPNIHYTTHLYDALIDAGCEPKKAEAVVNAMQQHDAQILATYATRLQLVSLQKQIEQRFANQAEVRKLQLAELRKEITLRAGALIAAAIGLMAAILGLLK